MCGRFALTGTLESLVTAFEVESMPAGCHELPPRYNVTPGTGIPVVIQNRDLGHRELEFCTWGLLPPFANDPFIARALTNARSETAATKPSFRSAMRYRRCLIPANGFFEWQRRGSQRQPYFFRPRTETFIALAGLWEHWGSADGSEILSCAVLTTCANALMQPVHDRMPVIIESKDFDLWLNPKVEGSEMIQHLLRPCPDETLRCYPVSSDVSHACNDGPELIQPIDLSQVPEQGELFSIDNTDNLNKNNPS